MARLVGAVCTSHIPAIGHAMARGLEQDVYWRPFFAGYPRAREWLTAVNPHLAIVVYNDHGLNFFLDKMPAFAVGAAREYRNADEGWGLPTTAPYRGDPELSWHIIESLMGQDFDVTSCQEMLVDHGFTVPLALLWPRGVPPGLPVVPVCLNTIQHPLPSPMRCFKLGRAIGRAIASYPQDLRVVVIGTGGMSHQLDGERAGFINKEFDLMCLEKMVAAPLSLARFTIEDLVVLAGTQGVELISWLVARGALDEHVAKVHSHYHIPVSNTAAGLMVLENAAGYG
jgi:protocatechuate 4,5-dioxygenase beta chain